MKESAKDWLSRTASSFVASFLSGFLLLLIGTLFIHKGTSQEVTKNTSEPLRSVLEGVHRVSSDILGVTATPVGSNVNTSESSQNFGMADEWRANRKGPVAGKDTAYGPVAINSQEASQ